MRGTISIGLAVSMMGVLALSGCTAKHYRKSADKESYKIIERVSGIVGNMPEEFSIEPPDKPAEAQAGTTVTLTLEQALQMSAIHSREYQSRKEDLYIQALSLSLARWSFAPIMSAVLEGAWTYEGLGPNPNFVEPPPPETDDDGNIIGEVPEPTEDPLTTIHTASGRSAIGIRKRLLTGGDASVQMVTNLFRIVSTADPAPSATSVISAAINQPLLRGAGPRVALEPLTQAERNMIYATRDFVRFRRTFLVGIAKDYFDILRQRNGLQNTRSNYQNLIALRERAEFLSMAGEMSAYQVDQARQDELSSYATLVRAEEQYQNALDEFKITIGLPTDVILVLDYADMDRLASQSIEPPAISENDAITVALANRLDLKTTYNRVDDADRRLYVARNSLLPQLDVFANYRINNVDTRRPLKFESYENDVTTLGASIELPLDRKAERNAYRIAIIDFNTAKRNLEERIDRVKQDVRNALRAFIQAEQSYRIQQISLNLAERRVESLALLQEAGQATTRDVLDAQESLLRAQNALTGALVDHYYARLDLTLAMETLPVADNSYLLVKPQEIPYNPEPSDIRASVPQGQGE